MRKYLIQPTKHNYYSGYVEWLNHHNVKEEIVLRYQKTAKIESVVYFLNQNTIFSTF